MNFIIFNSHNFNTGIMFCFTLRYKSRQWDAEHMTGYNGGKWKKINIDMLPHLKMIAKAQRQLG